MSQAPLHRTVIAISTAHCREDLARTGYLAQHQDEALIYLLRPLIRLGADLLYGGNPPRKHMDASSAQTGTDVRNITLTLMQLMSNERRTVYKSGRQRKFDPADGPLLFNVSTWPDCESIQPDDEAAWINACHVHRVKPGDAGLPNWPDPQPVQNDPPSIGQRRYGALILTRMRQILAGGFKCDTPGGLHRRIQPAAFVFIGGATQRFRGAMPGVMEEFLFAIKLGKSAPIYLMGGLGGATGIISRALLSERGSSRPEEFTMDYYRSPASKGHAIYESLVGELQAAEVQRVGEQFEALWNEIATRRDTGDLDNLFGNGLDDKENRELLTTTTTTKAVWLIWTGMCRVCLGDLNSARQGAPTVDSSRRHPARKK